MCSLYHIFASIASPDTPGWWLLSLKTLFSSMIYPSKEWFSIANSELNRGNSQIQHMFESPHLGCPGDCASDRCAPCVQYMDWPHVPDVAFVDTAILDTSDSWWCPFSQLNIHKSTFYPVLFTRKKVETWPKVRKWSDFHRQNRSWSTVAKLFFSVLLQIYTYINIYVYKYK